MANTYIKFSLSNQLVQKLPGNIGSVLANVVRDSDTPVPVANPDFENILGKVVFWLIEFEADSYYPNREIGLDSFGRSIVIMPWAKNYGYWTDNNLVIKDFRSNFKVTDISKAEFEKHWNLFDDKHH